MTTNTAEASPGSFALSRKAELEYWFHQAKRFPDAIRLDKGEPDLHPHPRVGAAAVGLIERNQVKYSSGLPELKRGIAARLKRTLGVEYQPDTEVCITHGAMGGLNASLAAVCRGAGRVATADISWPTFNLLIENAGAAPATYPLERPGAGLHDRRAAADVRAVLVNSPHNPTGRVYSVEELQSLLEMAEESDAWVISDETYDALTFGGSRHYSIASLPGGFSRTLVVGSFSKTFCMTGWRVGYVAGPAEMMRRVAQVSHLATGGCNLVAQHAALAALEIETPYVRDMVETYRRRAELATATLSGCPALRVRPPEATFYLFLDLRGCTHDSRRFATRLLEEHGVAAVPGAVFGDAAEGHLRLCLTVDEGQLKTALGRLLECAASFN